MDRRFRYIELDTWKAMAKSATATGDVELRKTLPGSIFKDGDDEKAPIRIRLTTKDRDRDRDSVNPKGWDLKNFEANPVVLWVHGYYDLPIARDTGITVDAKGLVGSPVFTTADENEFGAKVERLIRAEFLNCASVGFSPKKWAYNEEERGVDFDEQELLEYSIVPVPAHPGALVEARSAGHDVAWISSWAEKALDELNGGPGLWVPRSLLESARTEARTAKLFALPGIKALLLKEVEAEAETTGGVSEGGDGGDSGAPSDPPPATPAETAPAGDSESDDAVIELVDEAESDELVEVDDAEMRTMLTAHLKDSLGPMFTALTGRID